VNYTNQTKKIYASVDYNYVPEKPKFDVSGATLSVTQCDGAQVGIKPQKGQKGTKLVSILSIVFVLKTTRSVCCQQQRDEGGNGRLHFCSARTFA
jgi:hypothetical protein